MPCILHEGRSRTFRLAPLRLHGREWRLRRLPALLALLALCALPTVASAHGALRRSEPAAGAHLTTVPRILRLTFNEAPTLAFTRVALESGTGEPVALGPVRIEADTIVTVAITAALTPGPYTITWQVAGADGHPVRGEIEFTIATGAAGLTAPIDSVGGEPGALTPAPGQSGLPAAHHPAPVRGTVVFDAESPAFVAVRSVLYFALIVVVGAVAFRQLVLRRGVTEAPFRPMAELRTASIGKWAARVTFVVALLRLVAQSYAMHGADAFDPRLVAGMVGETLWGWGWVAQVAAALVAERAFHHAGSPDKPRPDGATTAWTTATAAAVVLAATPALASHAAAATRLVPAALVADTVHVLAAGAWMGGLLLLLCAGIPAVIAVMGHRTEGVGALVGAFSPVALSSAIALAATGAFAGWLHVGSMAAMWTTPYGRLLLLKLGALGAVGAVGYFNWKFVLPQLKSGTGPGRLLRSGAAELACGALVIVLTAILVALPTP